MTLPSASVGNGTFIGIDVGGTKCAAGLLTLPSGNVLARHVEPTRPERGGAALLESVVEIAKSLQQRAIEQGTPAESLGLGVAELVSIDGHVLSAATIPWQPMAGWQSMGASLPPIAWQPMDVKESLLSALGIPITIEADVRAAARAEAVLGAGRSLRSFVYVTIGTGISASIVFDGVPYAGARGLTGTFASSCGLIPGSDGGLANGPPLEQFASGPAMAARLAAVRPGFMGTSFDALSIAEAGDSVAAEIVTTAGEAVGAAVAQLVNVLDPEAVILGGGLGVVGGIYRESLEAAVRKHVWSELHRDVPLLSAALGVDAGFVGAALAAANNLSALPQ